MLLVGAVDRLLLLNRWHDLPERISLFRANKVQVVLLDDRLRIARL